MQKDRRDQPPQLAVENLRFTAEGQSIDAVGIVAREEKFLGDGILWFFTEPGRQRHDAACRDQEHRHRLRAGDAPLAADIDDVFMSLFLPGDQLVAQPTRLAFGRFVAFIVGILDKPRLVAGLRDTVFVDRPDGKTAGRRLGLDADAERKQIVRQPLHPLFVGNRTDLPHRRIVSTAR